MKKAKFMLSAIAVFAVFGTGLAFKANKGRTIFTGTSGTLCSTLVTGEIVPIGVPNAIQKYAGSGENDCSYTYITRLE